MTTEKTWLMKALIAAHELEERKTELANAKTHDEKQKILDEINELINS